MLKGRGGGGGGGGGGGSRALLTFTDKCCVCADHSSIFLHSGNLQPAATEGIRYTILGGVKS